MSEVLATAAAALGVPEALVQRAAEARATVSGTTVDDILSAWAGGAPVATRSAPEEPGGQPQAAPSEPAPLAAATVTAAVPPVAAASTASRAPIPAEVTAAEATHLPDVITVPTAGIRERTNFRMPRWLTAVLIVAPLFALFALGGSGTGQCGEATELSADVVTGEIVNCDGTEFTGRAIGGGGTDFVALGERLYSGTEIPAVNCAGCHGGGGQGAGNFPALTGVLTTFGACADHIEWVTLGSAGFSGGTYGDTGKTVAGGMPSFSSSLSAEQIAAVAAFERTRFGGGDADAVLSDCGLAGEDDEAPADSAGEALAPTAATG